MLLHIETTAQTNVDTFRVAKKNTKIAINDVIGNWVATDSLKTNIIFVQEGYDIHIKGLEHGVGNYSFRIEADSICVNGTAANWPPYYCTLNLLNSNELEINFYQGLSKNIFSVIYIRK